MLNLQICTVIIMTKKDKKINTLKNKKNKKKKNYAIAEIRTRGTSPRFEPGAHGFKIPEHIHYAMEAYARFSLK